MTEIVKNPDCTEPAHLDRETLWGNQCRKCGTLTQYADDITYVVGSKNRNRNQENLTRNLNELSKHLKDNQLSINQTKTQILETMISQKKTKTPGQPPTLLTLDELGNQKIVKDSPSLRILGGNIQTNLSWQSHLETGNKPLLPQIRKQIGRLKHLGNLIPLRNRINLGKGLILSRFNYLQPLWGGATSNYIQKAQIVLNTTARWMTGLPKSTRINTLMEAAGILSIKEQTKLSTLIQIWKVVHMKTPQRLRAMIEVTQDTLISTQHPRLNFTTNCFRWRGTADWNNLEQDLREEKSVGRFKTRLKRQIIDARQNTTPLLPHSPPPPPPPPPPPLQLPD